MEKEQEVTYYRFLSEVKAFLAKLLGSPINAEPSKYLKELGFSRSRLINLLIKKDVLERNEKILTPDKTGGKKVKYAVSFKVKKKNFERIIRRIYTRYFEKNVPEQQPNNEGINECDCGGVCGGGDIAGSTSCGASSGQYVQPFQGYLITRQQLASRKKDKDYVDPTKILGKELKENKNNKKDMAKKIYLTEAQFRYILKEEAVAAGATSTSSVGAETTRGDMGYDVPAFGKSKNTRKNKSEKGTDGDFFKPAMERKPGFSCERIEENVDENWKGAALGAAMGAASLFGGGATANANPMHQEPTNAEKTIAAPMKFDIEQLIKMFPYAYRDRNEKPSTWSRNRVKYEGKLPNNKISFVGEKAAKDGQNPWSAILAKYLDINQDKAIAFNDVK